MKRIGLYSFTEIVIMSLRVATFGIAYSNTIPLQYAHYSIYSYEV